jgi:hypothetical protein
MQPDQVLFANTVSLLAGVFSSFVKCPWASHNMLYNPVIIMKDLEIVH